LQTISLEMPEDIAEFVRLPPTKARALLIREVVLRLYEQGVITSAQGARLLRSSRLAFEQFLAENKTAIHGSHVDLRRDLTNIRKARSRL